MKVVVFKRLTHLSTKCSTYIPRVLQCTFPRRNWDPPPAIECVPCPLTKRGGTHTLGGRRGILGSPRNKQKKIPFEPKQTETRSVSRLFRETKNKKFRFVSEQTATIQNNPKSSGKIPKYTIWVGLLFVSVQSKHRNSLFRYRNETTETN